MSRIPIPDGDGPEINRFWQIDPVIGGAALALREAVYSSNHLPIRVHEAIRYMIAQVNQCPICLAARAADGDQRGLTEHFYESVLDYRSSDEFDEREKLALEYTYLFCNDHLAITDELFLRLRENFSDVELVDLCVTVSRHLGFGRLTQVLKLDLSCVVAAASMSSEYWEKPGLEGDDNIAVAQPA
jgi:AhpD family alkylhydroperoxidase